MLIGHYTSQTTFLEHILPTKKIRFSALSKTNDPAEYKTPSAYPVFDKVICSDHYDQALATRDVVKEEFKICWEKNVKLACFSAAADNNTPCWQKPRMWAQYGNNHHGVCLLFDRQRLDDIAKQNLDLLFSGHVIYGNDSYPSDLLSLEIPQDIPDIKKFISEGSRVRSCNQANN